MNSPRPNSKSDRIVAYIARMARPVCTQEIADQFGLASSTASAFLVQLKTRGHIRKYCKGKQGRYPVPATWTVAGGGR